MNAHTAKEEMALLSTGFTPAARFGQEPVRPGLFARAVAWLRQQRERRAVIEELTQLNDRELADIGLARSDVPHVFDRAFAEMREDQRSGTGRAFGAYNFG
jgi:uncharacterized protein YjiS (DUF1127 family)